MEGPSLGKRVGRVDGRGVNVGWGLIVGVAEGGGDVGWRLTVGVTVGDFVGDSVGSDDGALDGAATHAEQKNPPGYSAEERTGPLVTLQLVSQNIRRTWTVPFVSTGCHALRS